MRIKLLAPLHVAVVGVVWMLLAAAVWVTADRDGWRMHVAGRVLSFDDAPIANAESVVTHDRYPADRDEVVTRPMTLRTDADGQYRLTLEGAGRHVLTLVVDGQSARRETELAQRHARLVQADLELRNAVWYRNGPDYLNYTLPEQGDGVQDAIRTHLLRKRMERERPRGVGRPALELQRLLWLPPTGRQDARAEG